LLLAAAVLQGLGAIKAEQSLPVGFSGANAWMKSVECARTTGQLLVLCDGESPRAIAEGDAGDDPGHALVLGIYAAVTGQKAAISAIPVLNAIINGVGLMSLAGLLWWLSLPIASMVLLALGPILSRQNLYFSPHTAQFGATCLAMIAPIVILTTSPSDKRKPSTAWIVAAIMSLALASLFRQAMGLMGLVAGLIALGYKVLTVSKTPRHLAFYVIVLAALLAGYKAPPLVLGVRNFAYGLQPSERMETHGIWHNLYIGLGAVQNPFGIAWDDSIGLQHAEAIDPTVQFTSKHYYDVLRGAYFDIVVHHTFTVARIYLEKFAYALSRDKIWIMLLASAVPALVLRRGISETERSSIDAVLVVSALFICFFLGQAALFHWAMEYRFPIIISFILMFGVSIEMAVGRYLKADL
jgi:hypothetical protein